MLFLYRTWKFMTGRAYGTSGSMDLSHYSDLTQSQSFQPMATHLSKAALPLAKILATTSCRSSKTRCKATKRQNVCISPWIVITSADHWVLAKMFKPGCKLFSRKSISSLILGRFMESDTKFFFQIHSWQKRLLHPIEDNKTNVDRTFVFPLGWNWHDMDPRLFPNEIRHFLGQTFNARSSGIVELRNHSIRGRSPKSIFTPWQLWINIYIFFQKFLWLFEQCPVQPLWVLGMRCLHLPVRALSKVLLLVVWVWLVLPSTAVV